MSSIVYHVNALFSVASLFCCLCDPSAPTVLYFLSLFPLLSSFFFPSCLLFSSSLLFLLFSFYFFTLFNSIHPSFCIPSLSLLTHSLTYIYPLSSPLFFLPSYLRLFASSFSSSLSSLDNSLTSFILHPSSLLFQPPFPPSPLSLSFTLIFHFLNQSLSWFTLTSYFFYFHHPQITELNPSSYSFTPAASPTTLNHYLTHLTLCSVTTTTTTFIIIIKRSPSFLYYFFYYCILLELDLHFVCFVCFATSLAHTPFAPSYPVLSFSSRIYIFLSTIPPPTTTIWPLSVFTLLALHR